MVSDILNRYKLITQNLINNLQKNDLDSLDKDLETRQQCINEIQSLNLNNKTIYSEYIKLNLKKLDEKLNELLEKEKKNTLYELRNLKKKHNSNNMYNKTYSTINNLNIKI